MEKLNKEEIGKRIFNIRASLGETMEEFSKHFSTNRSTINNWEKGRNLPNKSNLLVLSELSGMTSDEILYGSDSRLQKENIELWNRVKHNAESFLFNHNDQIEIKREEVLLIQEISDELLKASELLSSNSDQAKIQLKSTIYKLDALITSLLEDIESDQFKTNAMIKQLELANKKLEELNKD